MDPGTQSCGAKIEKLAQDLRATWMLVRVLGALIAAGGVLFLAGDVLVVASSGQPPSTDASWVGLVCLANIAIGIGLVRGRQFARQAGGLWFVTAGIATTIVTVAALYNGDTRISAGVLLNGSWTVVVQLLCAVVLLRPRTAFVFDSPESLTGAALVGELRRLATEGSPTMRRFAERMLARTEAVPSSPESG